jgi:hypothetical protein
MGVPQFAILFSLYVVVSTVLCFGVANTIGAAIFYLPLVVPLYGLSLVMMLVLGITKRRHAIRFSRSLVYCVLGLQALMVLSSPANCFGMKQGDPCYSFVQLWFVRLFTTETVETMHLTVLHWTWIEQSFPVFVLLYVGTFITLLIRLRWIPNAN